MCRCFSKASNTTRLRGPQGQFLSDRSQTYVTVAGTTRVLSDSSSASHFRKSPVPSRQVSNVSHQDDKSEDCWRNRLGIFKKKDKEKSSARTGSGLLNGNAGGVNVSASPAVNVPTIHIEDVVELEGDNPDLLQDTPTDGEDKGQTEAGTLL